MEELKVEVKNRVGILTMNRPEKLNALTLQMGTAAMAALKEMADNPDIGAVVLTGAGRGFCAGGDVS
ncbi:MAG: enoyl-CoA hydratase/isomerase family protein, partial [Deltaproteobacteria bacterium]|nr:enoyl-CoA hydratase/isomerase family protein [Deltaproteobacteria bacterium]